MRSDPYDIDFESWRKLAKEDSTAFFAARAALIEQFIAEAPVHLHQRLRRLQESVDHSRAEAGSPARAAAMLMVMMGEQLELMSAQLQAVRDQAELVWRDENDSL
ncbi:MAG: hypothetical protein BSR46_10900 [Candidatus Dactylopiibacterium carminicum]|uniref:DUF3135 domain-containing protein n=1 Tax=Candidatus Dactylopiibacterium carminicum TaxID=857335 RepID=UPI000BCAFE28|nr:DUF3135 domain-containing protein [Candidatus Dactylopiibacterium carminicum]PAS98915.1 MAG: hypothetical protein BSR46_10900 [Candidatus Dactylopiibacterium carminicum]